MTQKDLNFLTNILHTKNQYIVDKNITMITTQLLEDK